MFLQSLCLVTLTPSLGELRGYESHMLYSQKVAAVMAFSKNKTFLEISRFKRNLNILNI